MTAPKKFFTVSLEKNYKYIYSHTLRNNNVLLHKHDFYEFLYIVEGSMKNYIDDKQYTLKQGDFSLIMPGETHRATPIKSSVQRDICIPTDIFESLCNSIDTSLLSFLKNSEHSRRFSIPLNQQVSFMQKLNDVTMQTSRNDIGSKILVISLLTDLLYSILPTEGHSVDSNLPQWVNKILLRFNDVNYIKDGIPAITKNINYNQTYINRIFKKHVGVSLGSYLNETRLKFSLTYLKTSTVSVNSIAEILGFSSTSFFYKKFKEKYGTTPNDYRKSILEQKIIKF